MFVLPKNFLLWLCCFALMVASAKASCERDENGNIIEKPESGGFGMGMLRRAGCKIEKSVESFKDRAKALGGEVKEAVQSGMDVIAKQFKSNNAEINQELSDTGMKLQQPDNAEQQQPGTMLEPVIDVRSKDIFQTGTDYIAPLGTQKPGDPESLDDRFLLNSPKKCPEGFKKDRHENCREV